jgi:phage tail-like protein
MSGEFFEGGYPPPAFYFSASIGGGTNSPDTSFSEVSGIGIEMETEAVVEGGENRFVHQLPKQIKHSNLEMKRGIAKINSPLAAWCKEVLEGEFIKLIVPKMIIVNLHDSSKAVLRSWTFNNAYPVKWDVEAFNSTKNEVAIEKMVFAYTYSNRTK